MLIAHRTIDRVQRACSARCAFDHPSSRSQTRWESRRRRL